MPETTTIQDLVNPQVMADMISAKITSKIVVTPFAKVDTALQGVPGDTITVPQYSYIGDAVDVAEGVKADTVKLQTGTTTVKIKKAMKAVELTNLCWPATAIRWQKPTTSLERRSPQRSMPMPWLRCRGHS